MANHNSWAASAASRRQTAIDKFWKTVESLWPNEYDYSKFEYLGATTKTVVTCKRHGDFVTRPTYLVNGNGCPSCGRDKVIAAATRKLLGLDAFIEKAREVHAGRYTYPEQPYTSTKTKLRIECPTHGPFFQKPNHHLRGQGCPECANDAKRAHNATIGVLAKEGLLARLRGVNPRWTYDISSFKGMAKPLQCVCAAHGAFSATPNNLLANSGCVGCGKEKHTAAQQARRLTLAEVAERGRKVHGDRFTYLRVEHTPAGAMVVGLCVKHALEWRQAAADYATYNPCTRCNHMKSSGEDAVFRYVSMFTGAVARDRTLIAPKELDIYLPDRALAIEYCGEYWHSYGDADAERRGKRKHFEKYQAARSKGVRLLTIYESEWLSRPKAIRRLLRNALGKGRGKLMARKCTLGRPSLEEARAFYERYHPQGGAGSGEHFGLYWRGKLVACMRFTFGANDRGMGAVQRVWTLTRFATRVTVAGGASRLFKAFVAEFKPARVKSFSDNRYFDGGMYAQLGFVLEAESPPDYQVWSQKLGLRPKAHYQRRAIPQRLLDHGMQEPFDPDADPRSEADMTYLMGARRIFDCGKRRWLWTALDA